MGSNGHDAGGKRKREDERKSAPKERRLRTRQEEMEEEFAAAFHAPTALYKKLEIEHLKSPLFLPRTLSYRLVAPAKKSSMEESAPGDVPRKPARKQEPASATLREFKIGMTAEMIEQFKRERVRVGLLFSAYAAHGRKFADSAFEPVATCLIPVPCVKKARLPEQFLRPDADVFVVTVQVVRVNDVIEGLATQAEYQFVAAPSDAKSVVGADLLRASVNNREPLFTNMLRIDSGRRRTGTVALELPAVADTVRGVVKLQFRVEWDADKHSRIKRLNAIAESKWPEGFIDNKDEVSDQLSMPKRFKPSPWTRKGSTQVWFHYMYHSLLRRMSEKRPDFSCAWCNLYAGSLRGLVSHLVSSHSRFRFHVSAGNDNVPHIYVIPHNLNTADADVTSTFTSVCDAHLDDDRALDRTDLHFSFISPRKRVGGRAVPGEADDLMLDRFDELDELDEVAGEQQKEFYAPLLQRQYFHSRTGAVVLNHEKDYDSDDDVDEEWIMQQSERLLDEFEDVSLEEKEFMKKWNRHVKENRILADFMVASSCRLFAKRHGEWLIESGLRCNFLLHLFNLWDNSLLNSRAIIDCMLIVDHYAVLQETKAAEAKDAKGPDAKVAGATTNGTTAAVAAKP